MITNEGKATMKRRDSICMRALAPALIGAAVLAVAPNVQALTTYLNAWSDEYSTSTSDSAGCLLCHDTSTERLNAYGADICNASGATTRDRFHAVDALDSDQDPTGSDNLTEINANSQPGWTAGENPVFSTATCAQTGSVDEPPAGVPMPYDPIAGGDPIADAGGPYEGLVDASVTFDGTGSSDDGTIVAYDWDFGDGSSGAGAVTDHVYTESGIYEVSLTVTDDDGNASIDFTTATIRDLDALDLDIAWLGVTRYVRLGGRSVGIRMWVQNNGTVDENASATVTGKQGGAIVYSETMDVFDGVGVGLTVFDFPEYTPTAAGEILWTATIDDGDPDEDVKTTSTIVFW